jgi:adenylate cyclase
MSHLSKAITLGLIIGVAGLLISLIPFWSDIEENVGLDLLFRLRGERKAPTDVVIVSIDKASADSLNLPDDPSKWSRSLYARLIDNLVKEGAAVIAFDMLFHYDRSLKEDTTFAEAIRKAQNVVLCECLKSDKVALPQEGGSLEENMNIERLVPPIPSLAQSAAALAPFPLPKVPVRVNRYWTFKTSAGDSPTLPVVALQIFTLQHYDEFLQMLEKVNPAQARQLPRDRDTIIANRSAAAVIQAIREMVRSEPEAVLGILEELENQTSSFDYKKRRYLKILLHMYRSPDSQYLNFYGPPGAILTIPFHQALNINTTFAGQNKFAFNKKAVFVGLSERFRPEQKDGFYTVFSQQDGLDISGVEIAATAFANLLEDMTVKALPLRYHFAIIILWGIVMGVLCWFFPAVISAMGVTGLSIFYLITAEYQFTTNGSWYPMVTPLFLQGPAAFFVTLLWKYTDSVKERKNIKKAFGYYLPDSVVDQLSKSLAPIKTGNKLVYGICLSTDAEQYTSVSETMDPQELSSFMNKYYESIFAPVRQHGGVVSNVVGDSMLAIWTTTQPDDALRNNACQAALDISDAVRRFNQSSNSYQLRTRIGIHSGDIALGNIGAVDHYEYRPVGDIVNTATRIEGLNKYLGTSLLASEDVMNHLNGFLAREIGQFLFVGKSKPLVIYELLCRKDDADDQRLQACNVFAGALDAFKRRAWEEAIEKFHASDNKFGEDCPSRFYLQLCEHYMKNPPEELWTGVIRMDKK